MKRGGRVFILLGIVLATGAGLVLFLMMAGGSRQASAPPTPTVPPPVSLFVAAREIPAGTVLTSDMLKRVTKERIDPTVPIDPVLSAAEAVDRMALTEIKADMPLRRGDLQPLPFVLPKGKKAMGLVVEDISTLAGLVRERDYVDILISMKRALTWPTPNATNVAGSQAASAGRQPTRVGTPSAEREYDELDETLVYLPSGESVATKMIFQRIQVLKIIIPPPGQGPGQGGGGLGSQNQAQKPEPTPVLTPGTTPVPTAIPTPQGRLANSKGIIVLAVSDQEAEVLRYVVDSSNLIQLVLRARDDADYEMTTGITYNVLVRSYGLPIERPLIVRPRPTNPLESGGGQGGTPTAAASGTPSPQGTPAAGSPTPSGTGTPGTKP